MIVRNKVGIFLSVMGWSVAHAQAPDGEMKTFVASSFYEGLVERALAALPSTIFRRCHTLRSTGSRITIEQPLIFAPNGYPIAGKWIQQYPISGCGNDTMLNFFHRATSDEKVHTIVGLPGTTIGDHVLQKDALFHANSPLILRGCTTTTVTNTHFEGFGVRNPPIPDPGLGKPRPWWETWTLVGCGRTFEVPLAFVPREKTVQVIQPGNVVER